MKVKKRVKHNKEKKALSIGVGGNTQNPRFPNVRHSAMAKNVEPKPNTQTMFFNSSVVSK